ncbi:hypothetical protein [Methylobacterium nodulans]|uniref:Enoyl-CoA hydratase/isomerase n=1 Tax=Methylobacterium nodulans (strain LMG 21967 / CNCM I-2342 / ORS 2060) TaxID=460265 RepID=B8IMA1_METNO|nr:hypothetical protein [Methylobacterium nodulans]ACL58287.1 hypothetical protein Mnod_3365 [Methylobacterium nodulans ORS 2060]
MDPSLLVTHHDGWTELTLNCPDRLNSFNEELSRAMAAVLDDAANGDHDLDPQREAGYTPVCRESVTAFIEKRSACFLGWCS